MQLTFQAVAEDRPGPKWQTLFHRYWPAYKKWFLSGGGANRPKLDIAINQLRRHMPELLPTFERLVELAGNDELAARFLTCYRPPAYVISCSQAALARPDHRVLVRNYDFDPQLNEGLILHSAWNGRRVIATSEFLWGVADGMNDAGLALSLAFGGRKTVGDGFGIPLILRYILEVCERVNEAIGILRRVPSHMAYNVTLLDRQGASATVHVAPDRPINVVELAVAANHQGAVEWAEHGRFTATLEREKVLRQRLAEERITARDLVQSFLRPPLYNTQYQAGFGTLYTAVYRPDRGDVQWHWPDKIWHQSLDDFREGRQTIHYSSSGASINADRPAVNDWSVQPETFDLAGVLRQAFATVRHSIETTGYPLSSRWDAFFQELEHTGRVPWEKLATLWTSESRSCRDSVKYHGE